METKIFKYLTLEDDEAAINSLIVKLCHDDKIDFYPDYRDLEDLEKLVGKCTEQYLFEDQIYEAWQDPIFEEQYDIARLIASELIKKYNCDGVSDSLFAHIQDAVSELVEIDLHIKEYLDQLIKVNLFITYQDSQEACYSNFDYKTLKAFLIKLGYAKPMQLIKMCEKGEYLGKDPFLQSLQTEIENAFKTQINNLCFIGWMTIEEYYKCKNNPTKTLITIPKNATGGFVDYHSGGGSVLDLDLPKDITIKASSLETILVEGCNMKYTVDSIYGLTSQCYKRLIVK